MTTISMNIDTETALKMIVDVASILASKKMMLSDSSNLEDGGFGVLEDTLLMAAKAIDTEHFDGEVLKHINWIKGVEEN